jgi:two-component system LytT family response regulator
MSKVTCIIVEDEPLAAKVLSDYVSQIPFLSLKSTFKDALSATAYLRDNKVDLLFLDIHLPKLKGMDFLRMMKDPPAVIITTAYHQYAVEGYELNVIDYLLKPFGFERFLQAVMKLSTPASATKEEIEKDYLFISVQKRRVKVHFADILYIESQREYIKVVTVKNVTLCKMSTAEIEELLPPNRFIRIHRSYIVAIDKIESISGEFVEIAAQSIPIGRSYRDGLLGRV